MKKVAFISAGYLPIPSVKGGAVETLIDILVESEAVNRKYKIDVYSVLDNNALEKSKENFNVNYYYVDTSRHQLGKYTRYLVNRYSRKYIGNDFISLLVKKYRDKLKEYDCVIVENKPEYGLYLKQYINGKMIFHSHNDFLNKNTKRAKEMFDCYDEIFCLSKYICDRVIEINPKEKDKVKLLYNGIDTNKFNITIDTKKERKRYGLSMENKVFLYTGRLVPEKGVFEMIEAFNKIDDDNLKLIIAGSVGYGKTTKNKFTKKLILLSDKNKNIIFTGYIPYNDMPKLYKIANYGIIPSMWEEPFALTVVEHLASNHPVIISNSGAMPELVDDNCSIIFEKNSNEIINLKNAMIEITTKKIESNYCERYSKKYDMNLYIDCFNMLLQNLVK